MSRKFFAVFVLLFSCFSLFSQENNENLTTSPNPGRFALGVGYSYGAKLDLTVDFDFGFLLFHNDTLDIRNYILLNAYSFMDDDKIENMTQNLTDKISVGWVHNTGFFRPYWYIEGGIGFYSNDSKAFWTTPLFYTAGLGVGLEIFPWKEMSFFFEPGLAWQFMDSKNFPVEKLTVGLRYYIK